MTVEKSDSKRGAGSSSGRILIFLAVLSICYIAGFTWILMQTLPCPADPARVSAFPLQEFVTCRTGNELGDFLAGAFAPIAFLWLAGTVFIQSRELATQRLELEQTRLIMIEQTAESRATKEFIGTQTEILKQQELERKQAVYDEIFDNYLTSYILSLAHPSGTTLTSSSHFGRDYDVGWNVASQADSTRSVRDVMFDIANRLEEISKQLSASQTIRMELGQKATLDRILAGAGEAETMIEGLSPSKAILARTLPFKRIRSAGSAIENLMRGTANSEIAMALSEQPKTL